MTNKIYLQCGYEDECKKVDCLNCSMRREYNILLTQAEETVIEDMGICDMGVLIKEKPEVFELMQKVAWKLISKIWKNEKKESK